jgi:hypothetical protein
MWAVWLVVLLPAASLKAPMSSDAGPSFATATFAFEHPTDVLHGATSESLYVEESTDKEPQASEMSSLLARTRIPTDKELHVDKESRTETYPAGWGPTGPTGGGAAAPASGAISATGDPHLQNVHGERFDLMKPGRHVLIHIPRGDPAERALLRVEAEARRLGGQCADMYFTELNITGAWVKARQPSGLSLAKADLSLVEEKQASSLFFKALGAHEEHPDWMKLGKVDLKVVHGRTQRGLSYLNFYVRHLGRSGLAVGGLLGEDDHTEATIAPEACVERLSLVQSVDGNDEHALASAAEASFD